MCVQGHTEETAYNTDILLFVKSIEVFEGENSICFVRISFGKFVIVQVLL